MRRMKKAILTLLITSIFSFILNAADANVRLNSIGFIPTGAKGVTANMLATSYEIRLAAGGAVVSSGNFGGAIAAPDSGETVYKADFSAFTTPGTYFLRALNGAATVGNSVNFTIAEDVYNTPYITSMRAMYLWRCNTAVSGTHNGDTFSHAACHMNDAYQDYIGGGHVIKNGRGGWHDAGDYNKYTVNAGATVGPMFMAWEHYGSVLNTLSLGLPETAPGYPEYLKEMKWEIDWLLTMALPDGSGRVSWKLSALNFNGFVLPEFETAARYFTRYGTAATADYVAMLAMAARIFRPYDQTYATTCINAARVSYNWLLANGANYNPAADNTTDGFQTGGYGTTDPDDRLWAAAEMWATTGDADAHADFITRANTYADKTDEDWDWSNMKNLGMYTYLMCTRTGKNAAILADIQTDIVADANAIVTKRNNHGYARNLGTNYYWGCNGSVARQTMLLQLANIVSPNVNYTNTALDAIGYLFGRNMHRRSYVTGIGSNPAMLPHDRRSGGDTVTNPWPGYLVGGSSGSRGDDWQLANMAAGLPPAQYWTDVEESYSSNEIAINWQGALIYALASFAKNPSTPTPSPTASRTPTNTPYAGTPTFTSTSTPIPTAGLVQAACAQGETFNIDGNLNEPAWQAGSWTSITRTVEGAAGAVTARFKVRWDSIGLLVGVEVTDPTLCGTNPMWYQDDSIEVYLDINNNGTATYGADDYQLGVRYNDPVLNVMPGTQTSTYNADSALIAGGYSVEYDIPWTDFGMIPSAGLTIGFDIGVNHDETCGGTRTGVFMWNGTANNWTDTSAFGEAVLVACGSTPTHTPTATRTRTNTPVNTPTYTATRTSTPVNTPTSTGTVMLTGTQTAAATDTNTPTLTRTFTFTGTNTPVNTATFTRTSTPTNTQTVYQSPTDSPTGTLTPTGTPPTATSTPTVTQTYTNTPVDTVTLTYTNTPVNTATLTWTNTPVNTFTRTATNTHTTVIFSPTFTQTFTRTLTPMPTATLTHTLTWTQTSTPVITATITQTIFIIPPVNTPAITPTVEAIVWPCPLNPAVQDLYVGYDITTPATSVKFRVYTKSFRLIKSVEILGTVPAALNTGKVDRQHLSGLSNGLYYYVIESTVNGNAVKSKIKQFIIIR